MKGRVFFRVPIRLWCSGCSEQRVLQFPLAAVVRDDPDDLLQGFGSFELTKGA